METQIPSKWEYDLFYLNVVFQLFWIDAVFVVDVAVSLSYSDALGSSSVQVTHAVQTDITETLKYR